MSERDPRVVVRWRGNTKHVSYRNPELDAAIERVRAEDPPGEAGPYVDGFPGEYAVLSRTAQLAGQRRFYHMRLVWETGEHAGPHTCTYVASGAKGVVCRHIALAWLEWQKQRIQEAYPWLHEREGMSTATEDVVTGREVALVDPERQTRAVARWEPSEGAIRNWIALAEVLRESEGTAIPKGLDTAPKIAAVLMAADAVGLDARAALLTGRVFLVNGKAQLDGQAMASLVAKYGGVIEWHQMDESAAEASIKMPGKAPFRFKFTREAADRAGLTRPQPAPNWENVLDEDGKMVWETGRDGKSRPKRVQRGNRETNPYLTYTSDMLAWKCVERLVRFGAPEVLNAVSAVVERPLLADFEDATTAVNPGIAGPTQEPPHDDVSEAEYSTEDENGWPLDDARSAATSETTEPTQTAFADSSAQPASDAGSSQAPTTAQEAHRVNDGDTWLRVKDAPFGMAREQDRQLLFERLRSGTGTAYTAAQLVKVFRTTEAGLARMSLGAIYAKLTGGEEPVTQQQFTEGAA